jgi:hypothetical protein
MDRILAPPQLVPSSAPIWTQAQFVISELDRVLGHQRPANLPIISPPSKCTYSLSEPHRSLRQQPLQKQKTSGPHADSPSGGVKALEAQVSSDPDRVTSDKSRRGPPAISIHGPVLALPRVVTTPTSRTLHDQDTCKANKDTTNSETLCEEAMPDSEEELGHLGSQRTGDPDRFLLV